MITLHFHVQPQFKYELFHILHINNLLVGQERTYLFITERSSEPRRVAFFIHCQHYLVHHIRILVICYGRVWAKSHRITSQGTFHNSKKSVRDNSSLSCDHNACCWTWSAHWKFGLKELEKWRNRRGEKNMISLTDIHAQVLTTTQHSRPAIALLP